MVCDPCNVYHRGENLCYHAHIKNSLRDLMILERLGLKPGATLTARELYHIASMSGFGASRRSAAGAMAPTPRPSGRPAIMTSPYWRALAKRVWITGRPVKGTR